MKILPPRALAVALCCASATLPSHAAPVAYWSFDIDARDATGFHNGALVGSAAITTGGQGAGGAGEALSISGGEAFMVAGNPTAFDFDSDFTWHAYVKTEDSSGAIFSRNPAGGAWNQGSKALFVRGGTVQWDTGWVGNPGTGVAVDDGGWHQIIATYAAAADRLEVFVDPSPGATAGSYSGTHDANAYDEHDHEHNGGTAATSFTVGQADFSGGLASLDTLVGLIDEVAVFDTALAGAELDQLIAGGPAPFFGPVDPPDPTGDRPFISEIVAVGNGSFEDGDGDTPDWIEIYNPTGAELDLGGYHLTDDPGDLTKWTFPPTPLPAGAYLIVFASDKDRATAGAELHLNFKLASSGDYLALVEPDGSTLAAEFTPTYPPQVDGFSYGVGGPAAADPAGYFAPATPGAANGAALVAPLLPPALDPPCGTFTGSIAVAMTPAFAGTEVRYTTDGSEPSAASALYAGPVTLAATTHLRARAFDPDSGGGGGMAAGSYQKLATSSNLAGIPAPGGFTSNLPIVVVENFGAGGVPGPGSALQTARVSVFEVDPATGRSALTGGPDACFRIGIRRRGQSSSGFAKPQYRVELRDESDVDLDYPLLGLPPESDWVFNGPWTDKALVRNSFSFELGREIGVEAPRTKHFEMFLSTDGGDLTSAEYVGVYVLFEKIKRGGNRTDIKALDAGDNAEPEISGGYMLRFEPPGIANDGPRATGWGSVEIIEPQAPTAGQRAYIGGYLDDFVASLGWSRGSGANNSGAVDPDPLTGYPAYIDVDSFVNLFMITELGRDQDAYVRSDYMFKDRGGKLHKGPLWDHNLIMDTGCCFDNRNPRGWQYRNNYNRGGRDHSYEPDWIVPLMRDPDFRQRVIDRWAELRRHGAFEIDALFGRLDAQAEPLAEAAVRNFAKWNTLGQNGPGFPSPSTSTWEEQIDAIKDWLTIRLAWIDSEFLAPPELSPAGGQPLAAGSAVVVESGEPVYFTTDGSDPRLPGGGISPTAAMLPPSAGDVPATFIARNSEWAYLDDGSDQGPSDLVAGHPDFGSDHWKHPDYDDSTWARGAGILGFGGLGSPAAPIASPLDRGPATGRHRTYYFRKSFQVEGAAGVRSLTGHLLRDDGAILYLNGREVARDNTVAGAALGFDDLTGAPAANGAEESTYFEIPLDPADLVEGENLIAVELHQQSSGSSDLGFDFELAATVPPGDAPGVTIEATTLIRTRARDAAGEWSAPTEGLFVVGIPADASNLIITEMNYHPAAPSAEELAADASLNDDDFEWLELKNIGAAAIDLSGIAFRDGIEFSFPPGSVLAAGSYALIVEDLDAFELRYGPGLPVFGTYANKLDNDGEHLRLDALDGAPIASFTFNDIWHRSTDGGGPTLTLRGESAPAAGYGDPASWRPSSVIGGTPAAPDGGVSTEFETWLARYFDAAELADPAVSGPLADVDADSISTLLEYALGLDPKRGDAAGLPAGSLVDEGGEQYLALTFRRQRHAADLSYRVGATGDLADWGAEATIVVGAPQDNGDGTETVTIRDHAPLSAGSRRALRLEVER